MSLTQTIQQLDSHLSTLRPAYYQQLQPGLSSAELQSLEQQYSRTLPDDIKALYQWRNGQGDTAFDAFVKNQMFVPLAQALDTAAELTAMIGTDFETENWWNKAWLPLFHNGGGDYICYDTQGIFTGHQGQLIEFWHTDKDRNVIAPDLEAMLGQLNSYYAASGKNRLDEYIGIAFPDGYPVQIKV